MKRAKKFESEVAKMLSLDPLIVHHYHPPDIPPQLLGKFSLPHPLDFYAFKQGGQGVAIECKTLKAKSLPYTRFRSKSGSWRQWDALVACAKGGVETFVFLNHYGWDGRDGQRGKAYAVPVLWMAKYRVEATRKSWPLAAIVANSHQLTKITGAWE